MQNELLKVIGFTYNVNFIAVLDNYNNPYFLSI